MRALQTLPCAVRHFGSSRKAAGACVAVSRGSTNTKCLSNRSPARVWRTRRPCCTFDKVILDKRSRFASSWRSRGTGRHWRCLADPDTAVLVSTVAAVPVMDQRLLFDVIAAILLAATAAVGAYAPVWISGGTAGKVGQRSMAYSVGNMFSAGVMVSAGFCHLLADAERRLHSEGHFPLAPFLCALGFLLTLFADNVAHHLSAKHGGAGAHDCHGSVPLQQVAISTGTNGTSTSSCELTAIPTHANGVSPKTPKGDEPDPFDGQSAPVMGTTTASTVGISAAKSRTASGRVVVGGDGYTSTQLDDYEDEDDEERPLVSSITNLLQFEQQAVVHEQASAVSFITAVLLGIALCFHSLLEGAAMGAVHKVSDSLHIFIAIIAHKGLAAYALGSSLVDSRTTPKRFWAVVLSFVFSTPIGIFLGYLVSEVASGDGTASISALAAGTFLYVAAMEVIPKELAYEGYWLQKLSALMIGFFAMSLLAIWA